MPQQEQSSTTFVNKTQTIITNKEKFMLYYGNTKVHMPNLILHHMH